MKKVTREKYSLNFLHPTNYANKFTPLRHESETFSLYHGVVLQL